MLVASVAFSCSFMRAPNSSALTGSIFQPFISVHDVNHVLAEHTGHGTCRTGTCEETLNAEVCLSNKEN